ncbi:MAG: glycosyltransferase family 4 protein [Cyanobacteria bacterium J06560_2]
MNIVGLSSTTNPYVQARWSGFTIQNPDYTVSLIEFGRVSKVYAWTPIDAAVPYERMVLSDGASQYESVGQLLALTRRLFGALAKACPDVLVLNGYQQPLALAALGWSRLRGIPVVLLSESKEDDAPRRWLTEGLKRFLVGGYSAALVGGQKHKDYLVRLGMGPDSIFLGHNVIGNGAYAPERIRELARPQQTEKPYFLAINRFIAKKNIPTILLAYADYRRRCSAETVWDLVLCGDGEMRSQIEAQITQLGLSNWVHLTGFLQPPELLPYFAHASCFVHASTQEQWGLVVNEAMAAGLPVLVSRCCGCFDELVVEPVNGFGFDANDPHELAALMTNMSRRTIDLPAMSQAALRHIHQFGPSFFAEGLRHAIEYSTKHTQKGSLPRPISARKQRNQQQPKTSFQTIPASVVTLEGQESIL